MGLKVHRFNHTLSNFQRKHFKEFAEGDIQKRYCNKMFR